MAKSEDPDSNLSGHCLQKPDLESPASYKVKD